MNRERSETAFGDRAAEAGLDPAAGASDGSARTSEPAAGDSLGPLDPFEKASVSTVPSEFDAIEEVDAVGRSLRRSALEYAALFLGLLLVVPLLSWLAPPWFTRPVWGGLTLNFLAVAAFLYLAFVVIALAYVRFAEHVEDRMLGRDVGGEDDA